MQLHTLMPLVRDAFNTCPVEARYCALKKFIVPPPVEVEKLWGKTTKVLKHSSLAFAICALKESTSTSVSQDSTLEEQNTSQHNLTSAPPTVMDQTEAFLPSSADRSRTGRASFRRTA